MEGKVLHPSVEKFKSFVKQYPKIGQSVKDNENTWQDLYEDWFLLGEDDPKWDAYKGERVAGQEKEKVEEKSWVDQFTGIMKKMDANQVQYHLQNLSQAIGAVQGVLMQFQGGNEQSQPKAAERKSPFSFRKD
ncbi:YlbD family protein [Bacillus sp. FJAT-50079]|uniref:YlbD family protein n=1 Tax=Bacillus sp. FJAT-50079 TaxID=2833577 RepID=UPI001BC9A0A6|nr:YlbD family protein [Bacillus sp. FJAT-50079]MBS4207745.1 YlbD family protein [Bacillus sp. FJAT-50079]